MEQINNSELAIAQNTGVGGIIHSTISNAVSKVRASLQWVVALMTFAVFSGAAHAQSEIVELDTDVFIVQINQWLPMAIQIVAIGVGIAAAFALAYMVGSMLVKAFRGQFG